MEREQLIDDFLSLVEVEKYEEVYRKDIIGSKYFGMPLKAIVEAEKRLRSGAQRSIAYFSMEYGLASSFYNKFSASSPVHPDNRSQEQEMFSNYRLADYFFTLNTNNIIDLPIYSGGLGVLAGDTVKTMADYSLPVVAIGMLWNSGYFRQKFWFKYGQVPEEIRWDTSSYPGLVPLKNRIKISLKSEEIYLRLWKYYVYSYRQDCVVPLILLDSNIEPNSEKNRHLTDQLYRSDDAWIKVMQRIILGMGGICALKELGYQADTFHLNEGHAVFAFIEKIRGLSKEEKDETRKHFVYTCHTPVQAGHDKFFSEDLRRILKEEDYAATDEFGRDSDGMINLTLLAMNAASVVNAVSKSHQKIMHLQFPKYKERIKCVTNGVHAHTWISDRFMKVFENFSSVLGDVKANPLGLAKVKDLKNNEEFRKEIWEAHQANKTDFCDFLGKWEIKKDIFTICWARRVATYKRPSLILQDIDKLVRFAKKIGPIQIIFAGKAHPQDNLGFTYINNMLDKIDRLTGMYDFLKILMLENYDIFLAKKLVSAVDVWLNNPLPPFEASGTSGMKAILNGVVQMSTLDGWVAEAEDKGIGRIFGYRAQEGQLSDEHQLRIYDDSQQLYVALEEMMELYYRTNNLGKVDISSVWIDTMINCIAAASHFNTNRMLNEYKQDIWKIS